MFTFSFKKFALPFSIIIILLIAIYIYSYRGGEGDLNAIDANSNGVWDDYEKALEVRFRSIPNAKNAAIQMGKSLQIILADPSEAMEKDKAFSKAMSCLVAAGMYDGLLVQEAAELVGQVRDLVVSNDLRQDRYIKFNSNLSGQVLEAKLPDLTNCEFKISERR